MSDFITLTLPITEQGANVLTFAATIGFFSGLMWLMLGAVQSKDQGVGPYSRLLVALGWTVAPIWLALLAGTLLALWQRLNGLSSTGSSSGDILGMGAVIVALLGAPFLIWSTVLKHQTVRFTKEGHMTDRINKAVEQLGAEKTVKTVGKDGSTVEETKPNIEVRIGGVLSLERIAQDSTSHDKGRDHVRVMEILCAYVRENAPASSAKKTMRQLWEEVNEGWDGGEKELEEHFCAKNNIRQMDLSDLITVENACREIHKFPKPRAVIALTMQVLGRRTAEQRRVEAAWPDPPNPGTVWPFDLSCPELPEREDGVALVPGVLADFALRLASWKKLLSNYAGYRLDLSEINLQGAQLIPKRPDASDAVLSGAIPKAAKIEGANLRAARIEGAVLATARLEGANLNDVQMRGANLGNAWLEGAQLNNARLEGADLNMAEMEETELNSARLEGVDLFLARMEGANMSKARMEGANLVMAWMGEAILDATRMERANLNGARIEAAKFRNIDLSNCLKLSADQINSAFGDGTVILSGDGGAENANWPAHWPKKKLEWEDFITEYEDEYDKWRASPETYTPPPP